VKLQCFLTLLDKIVTHRLGLPEFQPLQVKRIEERGVNRAWKMQCQLGLKEAAPPVGSAFCVSQGSQQGSQTMPHKHFQQLKEKNAKEKQNQGRVRNQ
jgi:hypothetical protein